MPTISEVRDEKVTHWYAYGKNKRSQAWSPIHDVECGLQDGESRDPFYLSEAEADDAVLAWLDSKGHGRSAYETKVESRQVNTDRSAEMWMVEYYVRDGQEDCFRELAKLQRRYESYVEDIRRIKEAWDKPNENGASDDERLHWLARQTERVVESLIGIASNAQALWILKQATDLTLAVERRRTVYSKYDLDPMPEPEAASATTD